jgi:hypothetical protein
MKDISYRRNNSRTTVKILCNSFLICQAEGKDNYVLTKRDEKSDRWSDPIRMSQFDIGFSDKPALIRKLKTIVSFG